MYANKRFDNGQKALIIPTVGIMESGNRIKMSSKIARTKFTKQKDGRMTWRSADSNSRQRICGLTAASRKKMLLCGRRQDAEAEDGR